ncbi:MAG: hypothetical protein Alpg2KO_17630 [Alphaproteobacteria bacterium]
MADPKPKATDRLDEITRRPSMMQRMGQAAVSPFIKLIQLLMQVRDQFPRLTKGMGVAGVAAAIAWGSWTAYSSYDAAQKADIAAHRGAIIEAMAETEYGRNIANLGGRDGAEAYLRVDEDGKVKSVWTRDELLALYRSMEAEKSGVSRRDDCIIRNWNERDTKCGPNAEDPLTRPMR